MIKRPKHTSYDHIGQKRAIHLSKILRAFLTDRIGSGEIGDILAGKNFHLTNVRYSKFNSFFIRSKFI